MISQPSCHTPGNPIEPVLYGDYSFNTGHKKQLSPTDYAVLSATLATSALIGLYQAWQSGLKMSMDEFMMADRSLGPFPVCVSLLATFTSSITLMGNPAEVYNFGTLWVWASVGFFFTIAATAQIYMPVFYQLKISTTYQVNRTFFLQSLGDVPLAMMIFFSSTLSWRCFEIRSHTPQP